jgi:hypothetical protein
MLVPTAARCLGTKGSRNFMLTHCTCCNGLKTWIEINFIEDPTDTAQRDSECNKRKRIFTNSALIFSAITSQTRSTPYFMDDTLEKSPFQLQHGARRRPRVRSLIRRLFGL